MAHRIGPTPQIVQPTGRSDEDIRALGRQVYIDSTDLRARLRGVLPKDGSERMENPLPFQIISGALPAASLWEGAVIFNTDLNRLMFSDGTTWYVISGGGLYGRPAISLSSTPFALTAEHSGALVINFGSNREVDLPAPTSGLSYSFWTDSGTLTLDLLGSEVIIWPDNTTSAGSFVMPSGGSQCIITTEGSNWVATSANFNQLRALNVIRKQGDPNEGGELLWEQSSASTLSGDVVSVDLAVDSFRIFEGGGNSRGFTFPMTDLFDGAGSVAGMVRHSFGTVTNAASLSLILPATQKAAYRAWKVVLTDWVPVTDNTVLMMRTSTNGGSSYDSGASDYGWIRHTVFDSGGVGTEAISLDAADSEIEVVAVCGNNTGEHANVEITGYALAATSRYKTFYITRAQFDATAAVVAGYGQGTRLATADIDAIQLFFSSGNISTGNWALYGIY